MNSEVISSRYAKALLSYVMESGAGEKVYFQIERILKNMQNLSQLREYVLMHDDISLDKKLDLLSAAVGEPLADELKMFVALVSQQHRMELLQVMFWAFISRYREAKGIKVGSLITAIQSDSLRERLEEILGAERTVQVHFETDVNPELIGGFVFEIDGYRLDASVRTRLKRISDELIDNSNRII